ncbi:MAG: polysaccharide deacetylase family protein [Caulobacteraceae bacterium]
MLGRLRRDLTSTFSVGGWLPVLDRAPGRSLALTFDDGPSPATTPDVLALLRRYEAKATFFLCGHRVQRWPELVEAIVADGHGVYAHGFSHVRLDALAPAALFEELTHTEALLSRVRPTPSPYLIRLPFAAGHRAPRVHRLLRSWRSDCQVVHWRVALEDHALADGCESEAELEQRCIRRADAAFARSDLTGSIVLLHEDPLGVEAPLAPRIAPLLLQALLARAERSGMSMAAVQPRRRFMPWEPYVRFVAME